MNTPRILFVCSGNQCRSPMAMYTMEYRASLLGIDVDVDSAGTLDILDRPPPKHTIAVMRERNINVGHHRSQALTEKVFTWATRVFVMTYAHAATVRERFEHVSEPPIVELLGQYGAEAPEIADPMGRWRMSHRKARNQIERCIDAILDDIRSR